MTKNLSVQETKNLILRAAVDEFTEKGMGKARTEEIAKRAGVATGLVHYHFKSKNNLYKEVIKLFFNDEIVSELTLFPYHRELTVDEKLHFTLYAMHKSIASIKSQNIIKFIFRLLIDNDKQFRDILSNHDFFEENFLRSLLQEGIDAKLYQIPNINFAAISLIDSISFQFTRHYTLKDLKIEEGIFTENFADDFLKYLIESTFKLFYDPNINYSIPDLPDDLKTMIDTIIDNLNEKSVFGTYAIIFKILNKIIPMKNREVSK